MCVRVWQQRVVWQIHLRFDAAARVALGWYLDGVAGSAPLRARLMALTDPDAVLDALRRGLDDLPAAVAA